MRVLAIATLAAVMLLAHAGAARAQGFDAYVGRPVAELAMRIGPPTAASPRDGGMVFKWNRFGPAQQKIGSAMVVEGLMSPKGRCVLLVMSRPARANPTGSAVDWIMVDWKFVGMGCV